MHMCARVCNDYNINIYNIFRIHTFIVIYAVKLLFFKHVTNHTQSSLRQTLNLVIIDVKCEVGRKNIDNILIKYAQ